MSVRLPIFDVFSGTYDFLTGHGHWRHAADALIARAALPAPPAHVLDIGCGPGVSTFALADALPDAALILGVDLAPAMVARARRHAPRQARPHPGLRFEVGDATALSLPDAHFDLITGHSFLYLVRDRAAVLRELRRVLRPGGRLALLEPRRQGSLLRAAATVPQRLGPARRAPWEALRFGLSMVAWRGASAAAGRLDEAELRPLLAGAGLEVVEFAPTLAGLGLHVVAAGVGG